MRSVAMRASLAMVLPSMQPRTILLLPMSIARIIVFTPVMEVFNAAGEFPAGKFYHSAAGTHGGAAAAGVEQCDTVLFLQQRSVGMAEERQAHAIFPGG